MPRPRPETPAGRACFGPVAQRRAHRADYPLQLPEALIVWLLAKLQHHDYQGFGDHYVLTRSGANKLWL